MKNLFKIRRMYIPSNKIPDKKAKTYDAFIEQLVIDQQISYHAKHDMLYKENIKKQSQNKYQKL